MVKAANLAMKFLLELVAFGALGYWGATVGRGALAVLLAIIAPAAAIAVWGLFAAPRAKRRLPVPVRVPLELGVFGLAAASLAAAGNLGAAVAFGVLTVANSGLLTVFRQWDQ